MVSLCYLLKDRVSSIVKNFVHGFESNILVCACGNVQPSFGVAYQKTKSIDILIISGMAGGGGGECSWNENVATPVDTTILRNFLHSIVHVL